MLLTPPPPPALIITISAHLALVRGTESKRQAIVSDYIKDEMSENLLNGTITLILR